MNDKEKIKNYWDDFLLDTGREKNLNYCDCFYFGRTKDIANELLDLVLKGTKKATTSCFDSYEINKQSLPKVGDISIVNDWDGNPKCIIETTQVTIIPFKDVTFDICKREGEDDCLESWQDTHSKIYEIEGNEEGYDFSWNTKVVFEDFKVIYK